ncbi:MAG TPA: methyltransferase domain-containing protein [Candidatus Dojkabacteria bacterium]|nr:methyltransferase domain-containing protein [Candidatus Dojkabacteria bacterium]
MPDISDYDKLNYDYSQYWQERLYENLAEKNLLNKIFQNQRGKWFLDIGGSYGRIASTYYDSYKNPVILDYSLNTLIKNKDIIKSRYPRIILIAANAYKMPFKESSFDGGLMVRVLHHIEKPEEYFKEAKRVFKKDATYIQEFANKVHIKAKIKALLRKDFEFFSEEPYEQPIGKNLEGSKKEEGGIFLNYHPSNIKSLLEKNMFTVKKKFGCSFLRSQVIKKLLGTDLMVFIEKVLQETLSWTNIPPSIFFETTLQKKSLEKEAKEDSKLKDILACPSCKGDLTFEGEDYAKCKKCNLEFSKKNDIWDFRIE